MYQRHGQEVSNTTASNNKSQMGPPKPEPLCHNLGPTKVSQNCDEEYISSSFVSAGQRFRAQNDSSQEKSSPSYATTNPQFGKKKSELALLVCLLWGLGTLILLHAHIWARTVIKNFDVEYISTEGFLSPHANFISANFIAAIFQNIP